MPKKIAQNVANKTVFLRQPHHQLTHWHMSRQGLVFEGILHIVSNKDDIDKDVITPQIAASMRMSSKLNDFPQLIINIIARLIPNVIRIAVALFMYGSRIFFCSFVILHHLFFWLHLFLIFYILHNHSRFFFRFLGHSP